MSFARGSSMGGLCWQLERETHGSGSEGGFALASHPTVGSCCCLSPWCACPQLLWLLSPWGQCHARAGSLTAMAAVLPWCGSGSGRHAAWSAHCPGSEMEMGAEWGRAPAGRLVAGYGLGASESK